jgi:crossover junction endodeoxyribonuclease RusA
VTREWVLDLTISKPLSMNDRAHWRVKAKQTKQVRVDAWTAAKDAVPALTRFTVELHYVPRDKRRRDPENLIATLKPFVDGLIDAGVAPDDCPPYYTTTMPVVDPPNGKGGRLYAIVRELLPEADEAAHEQMDVVDDGRDDDPWVA